MLHERENGEYGTGDRQAKKNRLCCESRKSEADPHKRPSARRGVWRFGVDSRAVCDLLLADYAHTSRKAGCASVASCPQEQRALRALCMKQDNNCSSGNRQFLLRRGTRSYERSRHAWMVGKIASKPARNETTSRPSPRSRSCGSRRAVTIAAGPFASSANSWVANMCW